MEVREATAVYGPMNESETSVHTDIGLLPTSWRVCSLGEIATVSAGGTPSRSVPSYWNGGIPWITTAEVDSLNIDSAAQSITLDGLRSSAAKLLRPGTLLLALYGQGKTRGKVGLLQIAAATNQACASIELDRGHSSAFVFHFLRAQYENIRKLSNTGNQENLSGAIVRSIKIPLPARPEQQAIAEALSDADALIESLSLLLAKKRQIKQGAMQELLTGKKRLPGFSGEWKTFPLGDIAHIKTGKRNNQDKVEDGPFPFFVRSAEVERIDSYSYDCEAILVPGEGGIGSIFHYIDGRFDVHQRVYAITQFAPGAFGKYVHLYMSRYFGPYAMQNSVKATVDSLRLPTFHGFAVRLPPTTREQAAIANVVGELEEQIAAMELRLTKARDIKQGMMQALLTGHIRLVQPA